MLPAHVLSAAELLKLFIPCVIVAFMSSCAAPSVTQQPPALAPTQKAFQISPLQFTLNPISLDELFTQFDAAGAVDPWAKTADNDNRKNAFFARPYLVKLGADKLKIAPMPDEGVYVVIFSSESSPGSESYSIHLKNDLDGIISVFMYTSDVPERRLFWGDYLGMGLVGLNPEMISMLQNGRFAVVVSLQPELRHTSWRSKMYGTVYSGPVPKESASLHAKLRGVAITSLNYDTIYARWGEVVSPEDLSKTFKGSYILR